MTPFAFFRGINPAAYAKNIRVISVKGDWILIKGINRQVVEITETQCEYFERVLFFVKPEFSAVSEGDLKERASEIAQSAGIPPATRLRKNKLRLAFNLTASALAGAAVSGGLFVLFSGF